MNLKSVLRPGAAVFLTTIGVCRATLYIANPQTDSIPSGTDISTYYPHVLLSSFNSGTNTAVFAIESNFSGDMVFGYDEGFGPDPRWQFAFWMRGDFSAPVDLVELVFIADTTVTLSLYDAGNNLLDSVGLSGNGFDPMTLSLTNANTAYFTAEATFAGNDRSDFLEVRYNVVPEPAALGLTALGALVAFARRMVRR